MIRTKTEPGNSKWYLENERDTVQIYQTRKRLKGIWDSPGEMIIIKWPEAKTKSIKIKKWIWSVEVIWLSITDSLVSYWR